MLQSLNEITLESNPIEKNVNLQQILREKFPGIKDYNVMSPKVQKVIPGCS
jgi:hypothetical protein